MDPFKRHRADDIDRSVSADRSAHFIYAFALGMPKSLATVKAASDHFEGSTRVASAPSSSRAPILDCLLPGAALT